ncbi:hypothetical protein [Pseudomonas sp. B28(2017)]|uniref:hypothetical protein n=1 Tax=Pseudomonas sp. B28(2017) TaxID=1981730 RepID=UPI002113E249|nr:hypothetical protein [Pseudomonas sp. B28(2017)]
MTCGDKLLLSWAGLDVDGLACNHQVAHFVSEDRVGEDVIFTVSSAHIAALDGGSLGIGCSLMSTCFAGPVNSHRLQLNCVKQAGHGPRYSEVTTLMIGNLERGALPAPTVLEAGEGWVDLLDAQDGVTIVIENTKAEKGELVYLKCEGEKLNHCNDREITRDAVGKPLVFIVPYRFWSEHRDSVIRVSYSVERRDDTCRQSGVTLVKVQSLMGH